VYDGAAMTSVKMGRTWPAMVASTSPFVAITPPYAETGSQAWARRWASATVSPTAMPHGLACLMMATAGRAWS